MSRDTDTRDMGTTGSIVAIFVCLIVCGACAFAVSRAGKTADHAVDGLKETVQYGIDNPDGVKKLAEIAESSRGRYGQLNVCA